MKLLQRARKHEIDGVAGQSVSGNCEARHTFAQENFKAHANDARQNNIGRDSISDGQSQHRRQPAIREIEDKNNQPDGEDAQPQDHQRGAIGVSAISRSGTVQQFICMLRT